MDFNTIPINVLTPGVHIETDSSRAVQGLAALPNIALLVGQRLSTGQIAAATPIQITRKAQVETYFGRGSMLAAMALAFLYANPRVELWAIALDDAVAGVKATKTVTYTGPATAAGTSRLYIGGVLVSVAVASGDANTAIATAMNAAVNAKTDLPVTATVNAGVVTLTARHKGECGNLIDVRTAYYPEDAQPAGVTAVVAAGVAGTTNPDLATAIAAMGDHNYTTVVQPYTDTANQALLEAEMLRRDGGMVQLPGQIYAAIGGTHAEITTWAATRNSQFQVSLGLQKSPSTPWEAAAIAAAVDAAEPDPARPRQTLTLPGLMPPALADRYTREERDLHLVDGVATFTVDAGGVCRIERLVTNYTQTSGGVPDTAFQDVEILRTLAAIRYTVRARLALRFPRHKLADDGYDVPPGAAIATPAIIRGELIALALDWLEAGWIEGVEQFKRDLVVVRSSTDPNRVDIQLPPDLINQLRVVAGQIQFRV